MSVVFSGVLPHSPILLPGPAAGHRHDLASILTAATKLLTQLADSQAEVIVIFSPHGAVVSDKFVVNTHYQFQADLTDFGQLTPLPPMAGALALADQLYQAYPRLIQLFSEQQLDYGTAVPLLLAQPPLTAAILPFYSNDLSTAEHWQAGLTLSAWWRQAPEKIALLASADLSNCLNKKSAAGYNPRAKWFDKKILKALLNKQAPQLLTADLDETAAELGACGLKPLLLLAGSSAALAPQPQLLAYECPLGVGWPVIRLA